MTTKDIVKLAIALLALYMLWDSGILDGLAANLAGNTEPHITPPIQGELPDDPATIILVWPTPEPTIAPELTPTIAPTATLPTRIETDEITSGVCVTRQTGLGTVTSCAHKEGE